MRSRAGVSAAYRRCALSRGPVLSRDMEAKYFSLAVVDDVPRAFGDGLKVDLCACALREKEKKTRGQVLAHKHLPSPGRLHLSNRFSLSAF